eukprot:TRINITY_DN62789_c0_g1_i1.p2 TRINITY_DN62789_c0_g1~~TRINITY_DN62789_c0_g1_i1.p2  ORF type:complete len:123 (+),score=51.18 TRINITY_DN62789_c0_g1_i1:118-486(+)
MQRGLVGSEMCIRDRVSTQSTWDFLNGKFMSEYDAFLAKRIAYVVSGGDANEGSEIAEEAILKLEREAFVDFCKEEKTIARIDHMLKTCLLYTSDAADDTPCVDLGGRRISKKKNKTQHHIQ